jgi:uncharacterized protein (DUF2384 family)
MRAKISRQQGRQSRAPKIGELRRRLGTTADRPLPQERFARLLGVSLSSVARWEASKNPDEAMAGTLKRLSPVLDAMDDMIRPEDRVDFLEQKHPLLLGMRPIDLLKTDDGAKVVLELLEGAESGAFA